MPSITIRNLPSGLHARLRERAKQHRRSLNAEIVQTLEQATASHEVEPLATIEALRRLRAATHTSPLTDEILREADAGRPA